jgi:hypothetical protein
LEKARFRIQSQHFQASDQKWLSDVNKKSLFFEYFSSTQHQFFYPTATLKSKRIWQNIENPRITFELNVKSEEYVGLFVIFSWMKWQPLAEIAPKRNLNFLSGSNGHFDNMVRFD